MAFPASFDLSTLNGSNGFTLNGGATNDFSGSSAAPAGDINGDGFADIIIGAHNADPNGNGSGASYVIFGKAGAFGATLNLTALNGSDGFAINGIAAGDYSGQSIAAAGDINGDGIGDLLISAESASPNGAASGAAYLILGKTTGFDATFELSSLNGSNGGTVNGVAAGDQMASLGSAGDFNGDGVADAIFGAKAADPHGSSSGATYVAFGHTGPFSSSIELSGLNGNKGFTALGAASFDLAGNSVASGDINGDGLTDVFIAAQGADPHGDGSGAVYVIYGNRAGADATVELSGLDGNSGFVINGVAAGDYAGTVVRSAGDVNGDGIEDIIIGADGADPHGTSSGASYVVFGNASGFGTSLDLSTLNGANGFVLNGAAARTYSGTAVGSAGDVNGDGFDDVIVGALFSATNSHSESGAAYVVYGKASGFAASIDLSSLNGTNGFKLNGVAAYDHAGQSVSSAGDVNGDGVDDLLIGASLADPNGASSGASYVVFGLLPDAAVNRVGTDASQTLAGGSFADTLSGLGGDDVLVGNGSGDMLNGGVGIDTARFSGMQSAYTITRNGATVSVSGPDGNDTLTGIEKAVFADGAETFGQGPLNQDFDANLSADILWQNADGQAAIWTFNGLTQLDGSLVGGNPGPTWHVKGSGDFDGDVHTDILWQNDDGQVAIWTFIGLDQTGGSPVGGNPGPTWHVITTGDFNGDGKADILWQNDDGQAAIWAMDGFTQLGASPVGGNPGPTWHVKDAADFDGDGVSDILWQNDDGQAAIWIMDGLTQTGGSPVGGNPGATWHVKGAADFNADGKADILWQNDDGQVAVWMMDGLNQLSGSPVGGNPGPTWHVKGAADFNADAHADILWQNDNGQAAIWTMNGFAQTGGAEVGGNPGSTWHVIALGG